MNRRFVTILFFCVLLLFLHGAESAYSQITSKYHKHKDTWKTKRGLYLDNIAEMAYGHRSYNRLIANYNRVPDMNRLQSGTVIKTPYIRDMFKEIGLMEEYGEAFERIFSTLEKFRVTRDKNRQLQIQKFGQYEKLFGNTAAEYLKYADEFERSYGEIEALSRKNGNIPRSLLRALHSAFGTLRDIGAGTIKMLSKDEDLVEQQIANALANAVAWSRE